LQLFGKQRFRCVLCTLKSEAPLTGLFPGPDADHCKLIYRHYATLYFIFVADSSESELGILDLIQVGLLCIGVCVCVKLLACLQVFVEALDKCFENVCELDLIFHPDRVCYILDEVIQGGMVLETRQAEILDALAAQVRAAWCCANARDTDQSFLQAKIEKDQDPLRAGIQSVINSIRRNWK
jgi:hypothetical protein